MLPMLLVCVAHAAAAQPENLDRAAEATRLFEQGLALRNDGKLAEACATFQKSYELDPAPGTALNVGDCLERDGKLAQAWTLFDGAARDYERTNRDAGAKLARERAAALADKLATVTVRVADPRLPGLVVKIASRDSLPASSAAEGRRGSIASRDSLPASSAAEGRRGSIDSQIPTLAAEITLHLAPGALEVSASAPGHVPFSTTAYGLAGKRIDIAIPALRAVAEPRASDGETIAGSRDPKRVRLAIAAGAGGAALWLGAGVLGLLAKSQYNSALANGCTDVGDKVQCTDQAAANKVRSAITKANIGTGFAIAGSVVLVGAAVLYFTAPRESVTVAPMVGASTLGLGLVGRF